MRAAVHGVVVSGAAGALAMAVFVGARPAFSTATGAAIAAANLWLLARIVTGVIADEPANASASGTPEGDARMAPTSRASAAWTLLLLLKMLGLLVLVGLLMRYAVVSPLPMLVGFGALPIGIAIASLVSDRSAGPRGR